MRPYSRQPRSFNSIISADRWIGVGDSPPPIAQQQLEEDLDYALAMPELVRFRRYERQVAADITIAEVGEEDDEDLASEGCRSSSSSGLHRSRGISERLVDLGRKARGSFANLMGRKDSLWREEAAASSMRGLIEESMLTQPEPVVYNSAFEAEHIEDLGDEALVDWPLEDMHLHERDPHQPSLHPTQCDVGELLASRLRAAESRGDFRSEVRDAIFAAHHIHITEQDQWAASYDLIKTSAERRRQVDEAFRLGSARSLEIDEDVDLNDLPFELAPMW